MEKGKAGRPLLTPTKRVYKARKRKPKKIWDPLRLVDDKKFESNFKAMGMYWMGIHQRGGQAQKRA